MPFNIGLFLKSRKGSKDMYNVLNIKTVQISAEQKWENILNKMILSGKIFTFIVQSIQKTQTFAGFNIELSIEYWEQTLFFTN
jgi:hypothetical protein